MLYVVFKCFNKIKRNIYIYMHTCMYVYIYRAFLVVQTVKNLPTMQETRVQSLGGKDPLEKGTATHSDIFAWEIPWTEDPGRRQSTGSQRARHG